MNVAKTILKGMFTEINAYTKTEEISQIHNLTVFLEEQEKDQIKPTFSRRK